MNKVLYIASLALMAASCHSRGGGSPAAGPVAADTLVAVAARPAAVTSARTYSTTNNKGKIETIREVPVFSRLSEQIVFFGAEKTGQRVQKGEVVVKLSDAALREKILHGKATLEKAEYQYQAILMGQGYKRDQLESAPDNIKQWARINSGYNEAQAALHELELQLSYCTIPAPMSGAVSKIHNTLYGAAHPGEPLFHIVDTEHLKVSFDVLENELSKYGMGLPLTVTTVAYPAEHHAARVSAISPVIDANGMVHIEATLQPHSHLMPGMTAFVTPESR